MLKIINNFFNLVLDLLKKSDKIMAIFIRGWYAYEKFKN